MSYSTTFEGKFIFDKPLDLATKNVLDKLGSTRRMKRAVEGYGIEGEFYFEEDQINVLNPNEPPSPQPSLWCDWVPTEDGTALQWNGTETFYEYKAWLQYIIDRVLAPRGITMTGEMEFQGEESKDHGTIRVTANSVELIRGSLLVGHA